MKPWHRKALWTLATVAMVYAMIYGDVVLRARHAYREGEKYWQWGEHPEERQKLLEAEWIRESSTLEAALKKGKLTRDDYDRQRELLLFSHQQKLKESSIQQAYVWYETAAELFSPPESKWVKLARAKLPLAKARWIAELKAKKVPVDDYIID